MKKNKRMRLPNGFGQISKLSGRLRKPYRAMVTVGFTNEGKPICKILKPVGYFATYNEAYTALLENAKSPYEKCREYTLSEVYEKWSESRYQDLNPDTVKTYERYWKHLEQYGSKRFAELKVADLENIIQNSGFSPSGMHMLKNLFGGMYNYALRNEIVKTNYATMIQLSKKNTYKLIKGHKAFSEDELNILWQHTDDETVRCILIQTYTGMRPTELVLLDPNKINIKEKFMIGGIKTENGIDRTIPIHSVILNLVEDFKNSTTKPKSYKTYERRFRETLEMVNISDHTPHDCRKTFVTLAKKYQVNEYAIKRIIGHSIKDLTENTYTERSTEWLVSEVNKISVLNVGVMYD